MDTPESQTETETVAEVVEETTPQFETVGELQEWMAKKINSLEMMLADLASRPIVEAEALTSLGDRLAGLETQTQEQLANLQASIQTLSSPPENQSMESQQPTLESETPPVETPPSDTAQTEVPPKSEEGNPAQEVESAPQVPENPPARRVRLV